MTSIQQSKLNYTTETDDEVKGKIVLQLNCDREYPIDEYSGKEYSEKNYQIQIIKEFIANNR